MGMLGEGGTSQAEVPGWGWYSGKAPRRGGVGRDSGNETRLEATR